MHAIGCERSQSAERLQIDTISMHASRAVWLPVRRIDLRADVAQLRLADAAVKTGATWRYPRQQNAITDLEVLDSVTELLDRPSTLVSEDARKFRRHDSGDDRKIGMTDSAGGHSHQSLVPLRRVKGDLFHTQGLLELVTDRCQHLPYDTSRTQ